MTKFKAKKLKAGRYQIGKLIVTRDDPKRRGETTVWKADDGEILGYTLKEIRDLANYNRRSLVYSLARGATEEQWRKAELK